MVPTYPRRLRHVTIGPLSPCPPFLRGRAKTGTPASDIPNRRTAQGNSPPCKGEAWGGHTDREARPYAVRRFCALLRVSLASFGLLLPSGCLIAPKAQLDECRQCGQALRAENDRLKDQVLALRSQGQDVAQRSVDDERRLKAQEEVIARLEQTVQAYQDDRERLAASFDRLKAELQSTAGPEAARGPSEAPETAARVVSLPVDSLFRPGSAELRPDADTAVKSLSTTLAAAQRAGRDVVVFAPSDDVSVVQAGDDPSVDHAARLRFLAMARANRLRERLAEVGPLGADRIRVADPDRPAGDQQFEIRLVRSEAALQPTDP